MLAALKHFRGDLIEQRRWLRVFIVIAGFIYMLGTGIARLDTGDGRLSTSSGTLDMLALGIIVFVIAWRLLTLDRDGLFPLKSSPGAGNAVFDKFRKDATGNGFDLSHNRETLLFPQDQQLSAPEHELATALEQAMSRDMAYREENLTITRLAAKLEVPESRLRRLINQNLGHRNFNDFLNTRRLKEVSAALVDAKTRHLPILTLALEAGFQSIGPFNRAFKRRFGMTPTEFRAKHSADSGIG
jgi:AraC-like DNA-binding protein